VGDPRRLVPLGIPMVPESPEVSLTMLEQTIINLQWRATGHFNNRR
jgi:hypothetical protein